MAQINDRKAGVLLHITSLPSDYGIGDLGESAYKFVDTLASSSVQLWQMLPVGPTGYGDSPYAARSAFAGNELMISPRQLYLEGYLGIGDVLDKAPETDRVDYGTARALKMPMLRRAASAFLSGKGNARKDYEAFAANEAWWLDDYALFQVLTDEFKSLFDEFGIDYKGNLKSSILSISNADFYRRLIKLLSLTLQMRNSITGSTLPEDDYLISPAANENGEFYDSRNYKGTNAALPCDADANGAYNIARKALWAIDVLKDTPDDMLNSAKLSITNAEWLEYTQR